MWTRNNLKQFKSFIYRNYANSKQTNNVIKYTSTINLPKTDFPQRLSATKRLEVEKKLRQTSFSELYKWQDETLQSTEFVLHDGPPYANGDLHMGHAVNKILKDITLRHHVIRKLKVNYKPGWDCHGLPIELKAVSANKKLEPLEIRKLARKYALATSEKQKKDFESWGVMADWKNDKNMYKTLSNDYIQNQLEIFHRMYEKKLIFRDMKPVHWSPSSRTALAEAELEYDNNFESPSVFVKFQLEDSSVKKISSSVENISALIWTTTPWTLPANQAICYNTSLEYSLVKISDENFIVASDLIESLSSLLNCDVQKLSSFDGSVLSECEYIHPIDKNEILPFYHAKHVQAVKGTGLVHTAPSHGPDDYLVSLEHEIPLKCLVDEDGNYNENAPDFLKSKNVLSEGNDCVINYLGNNILHKEKIRHAYPIDWRTKQPIIFRASQQWFINTEAIKETAIAEIEQVEVYPNHSSEICKNNLITQVLKRPYWCISRQRSWGVPIPVFYNKLTKEPIINHSIIQHLQKLIDEHGSIDFWWSESVEKLIPDSVLKELNLDLENIKKGQDILDIWFDSGVSWSNVLSGEKVADLYLEGIDQITGWFQSSLLTSVSLREKAPYKSLFVHGFTVDEKGLKMSKSLGNIILPKDVIEKYGIDAMRWWIASHSTQHSLITVSHRLLQSSSENVQKIRGVLKYLLGVVGKNDTSRDLNFDLSEMKMIDKHILNSLLEFDKEVFKLYKSYQYNKAVSTIVNFITNDLSGLYLHLIKDRLYCGSSIEHQNIQNVFKSIYYVVCKSIWPIVPFIVEESWSYYDTSPFYKSKNELPYSWKSTESSDLINEIMKVRQNLNQSAKDCNTWTLNLEIDCNKILLDSLKTLHPIENAFLNNSDLCEILQVASIKLNSSNSSEEFSLKTSPANEELCPRCRRFGLKEVNQTVCLRCDSVLVEKSVKL